MVDDIRQQFLEIFGKLPLIAASPGRVNLMGEHTDYNEGFVLPAAIDKCIYIGIAKNNNRQLNLYAQHFNEKFSCSINEVHPVKGWATYLYGMFFFIKELAPSVTGVDVWINGDIPVGAGLSSSAALCSAFGYAVNELFNLGLSRMDLALLGQKTEHIFARVMCGIMDQFASLHGIKNQIMKLDCRSLEYEYIPFHFPEYAIVLLNTMVSHSLAGSEYNDRRRQCEEGVSMLKKFIPQAQSLRDISPEQLKLHKKVLDDLVYKRCLYVVTEDARLLTSCELLKNGDLKSFGKNMFQTHWGLSRLYEVSCEESDFIVEMANGHRAVAGARQMGGGFGGCVINLVKKDELEDFIADMQSAYQDRFKKIPEAYITQIEEGARLLT
jgi:galactokinase